MYLLIIEHDHIKQNSYYIFDSKDKIYKALDEHKDDYLFYNWVMEHHKIIKLEVNTRIT